MIHQSQTPAVASVYFSRVRRHRCIRDRHRLGAERPGLCSDNWNVENARRYGLVIASKVVRRSSRRITEWLLTHIQVICRYVYCRCNYRRLVSTLQMMTRCQASNGFTAAGTMSMPTAGTFSSRSNCAHVSDEPRWSFHHARQLSSQLVAFTLPFGGILSPLEPWRLQTSGLAGQLLSPTSILLIPGLTIVGIVSLWLGRPSVKLHPLCPINTGISRRSWS